MTGRNQVAKLRWGAAGLCIGLGLLAGCTSAAQTASFIDKGVPAGSFQLVAFDSCDEALFGLRSAAKAAVGPYGFGGGPVFAQEGGTRADAAPGAPQAAGDMNKGAGAGSSLGQAPTPNYSGTNTHEAGVDEPDLVKTDGRRIITVTSGVLRVIDAAGRYVTGTLDLAGSQSDDRILRYVPADLLLAGDKALVLMNQEYMAYDGATAVGPGIVEGDVVVPRQPSSVPPDDWRKQPIVGPRLVLVDLAGSPRILSTFRADGSLVDARQVGKTARVVVRSSPHLIFPYLDRANDAQRIRANQAIIDQAGIDAWLPRIEVTTAGETTRPSIGCEAVNRPSVYTAGNLLTVFTFDLGASGLRDKGLGDGLPTTLVADGDTVYSNGPSLYVSSDQRRMMVPMAGRADLARPTERTEIYKFDTSAPGRPRFVAGGAVPGYTINQYAMSEWDGNLRVATTMDPTTVAEGGQPAARPGVTQSGVYVLAQDRKALRVVGAVEGLGKGERIYSVRFVGPVGYVVTFRQVDPLYTVDLSNPRKPAVRGELKIPGYSAYLHPVGESRLIGIGQNADSNGRVSGTQVSLFDVGNLERPGRLASYTLTGANSEAEFDPHAFLFWPNDGLLVVPLQLNYGIGQPGVDPGVAPPPGSGVAVPAKVAPAVGVLVLRVSGSSITEVGFLQHPDSGLSPGYPAQIRRSLIIGQTLWTVSEGGLMASDTHSLAMLGWIGFN